MARRRPLNVPLIKGLIMLVVGAVTGLGGAITGLGTQVAASPALGFLLGFTPERQGGTSMAFALVAAACGLLGAGAAGQHAEAGLAVLVAVAATIGALLVARQAREMKSTQPARIAQSMAMLVAVWMIGAAARWGADSQPHVVPDLHGSVLTYALLGLGIGAISMLLQVASGALLVPALIYVSGATPAEAILTSLVVVVLASLIPAVAHAAAGRVDSGAGLAMIAGGAAGGLAGGYLLGHTLLHSPIPLIAFGVVAMYLCAMTAYRFS